MRFCLLSSSFGQFQDRFLGHSNRTRKGSLRLDDDESMMIRPYGEKVNWNGYLVSKRCAKKSRVDDNDMGDLRETACEG